MRPLAFLAAGYFGSQLLMFVAGIYLGEPTHYNIFSLVFGP